MRHFDTVVVSDLHLGARNSRTNEFIEFLRSVRTERLIINGDLFEDPQLRGLKCRDVAVLEALRRAARSTEITLIRGNHDPAVHWYQGVLGLPVLDEILIDVGAKTYSVCHGHEWDSSMKLPPWLINLADTIYLGTQRLDPSHKLAKALKRRCKTFCRAVSNLRTRALKYVRERGLDGIILGHTHIQEDFEDDGVHYLNSGCWTERPSGYVGIRRGLAQTYTWQGVAPALALPEPVLAQQESDLYPSAWELAGA